EWWYTRSPSRRRAHAWECSSCSSSTTRSTARSVIRRGSASYKTSPSRKAARRRATARTMRSASTRSRTSVPTCCTSRTAVSCAPAACVSWRTSRRSPCSTSPSGATGPTSGSTPRRGATVLRGARGKAVALVSPRMSTEALFLARELLAGFDWTGAVQIVMGEEAPLAGVPNLALRAERAPNGTAADLLGYGRDYAAALRAAESAAVVLVLDEPEVTVQP